MGHWFLVLLLPLQRPSNEEAPSTPFSEGYKDSICLLGVSGSAGPRHTRIQGQGPGPGLVLFHLTDLLNHTRGGPCLCI